jgi:hypothetical protein
VAPLNKIIGQNLVGRLRFIADNSDTLSGERCNFMPITQSILYAVTNQQIIN